MKNILKNAKDRIRKKLGDEFNEHLRHNQIMVLIAQHMHALGERLNLHTTAMAELTKRIDVMNKRIDLLNDFMQLSIQAKTERLNLDENEDMPN